MTSTKQTHRPNRVRPRTIQNRIQWVLGQHGINVDQHTVESIWASLTTGDDPRPDGVPARFTFQGVNIAWPSGVGRRLLYPAERHALNVALHLNGNDLLDSEDNADEGRRAYQVLWAKTQQPGYTDPRVQALVDEACDVEFHGTSNDLTDRAQALIQADNVLCGHKKPGGRLLCLADNHHAGLHSNGKHTWTDTEVVKVQHHTTDKRTVKAQTPSRGDRVVAMTSKERLLTAINGDTTSELDDLLNQLNALTAQAL